MNKKIVYYSVVFIAVAIVVLLLLSGCKKQDEPVLVGASYSGSCNEQILELIGDMNIVIYRVNYAVDKYNSLEELDADYDLLKAYREQGLTIATGCNDEMVDEFEDIEIQINDASEDPHRLESNMRRIHDVEFEI